MSRTTLVRAYAGILCRRNYRRYPFFILSCNLHAEYCKVTGSITFIVAEDTLPLLEHGNDLTIFLCGYDDSVLLPF